MIRPRGANQTVYLKSIRNHDLAFGIGPAGTGKTYLAVATAIDALESEQVRRIVLVRPAVEAGERLGFLPGDMSQKVDPYLRPMYDALYDMMGADTVTRLIERNVIEIAPLAFMRGRSLNESFVILDEAQNTSVEQMKMFLTRIGFGSHAVVTGDITQIDLPNKQESGLNNARRILDNVAGIAFTFFTPKDVVRHPLVQRIVEAYESDDNDALEVDVQLACDEPDIPSQADICNWVDIAVGQSSRAPDRNVEVAVRIVDADEIRALNKHYRKQDKATNVLSFPAGRIEGLPKDATLLLGDVVICASIVAAEAMEHGKSLADHWGHMLVHGTLHLLGFEHDTDAEAAEMEGLETRILAARSVTDPYASS